MFNQSSNEVYVIKNCVQIPPQGKKNPLKFPSLLKCGFVHCSSFGSSAPLITVRQGFKSCQGWSFFQAFFLQLQKIIADLQGPLLLLTSIGSSNKIYFIKNCDKILSHKAEQHEDVDNIKRVSNTELNLSTQEHSPIYLLNQAEIWH